MIYKIMNDETTVKRFTNSGYNIANAIVSALQANNIKSEIAVTYLDYGQNIKWETVLVGREFSKYQVLNPRQFKQMNDGTFDYSEINEIVSTAKRILRIG